MVVFWFPYPKTHGDKFFVALPVLQLRCSIISKTPDFLKFRKENEWKTFLKLNGSREAIGINSPQEMRCQLVETPKSLVGPTRHHKRGIFAKMSL